MTDEAMGRKERALSESLSALRRAAVAFFCVPVDLQGYRMGSMNEAPM